MMVPSGPMAHCVVRQACLALAALQALFNTMFRFGYACKRCQRCLGRPIGEIQVDFDPLCSVALAIPYHHHRLLMAFLALRGARDHSPFDDVNDQRSFGPIAHVESRPGLCGQRGLPLLETLPGALRAAAPAAGGVASRSRLHVLPGTASIYRS